LLKAGACLALAPLAFGQDNPASQRPKADDLLVRASGNDPSPLKPSDIPPGAKQLFVWAMVSETKTIRNGTRLNRILLVRLDPAILGAATAGPCRRGDRRLQRGMSAQRLRSE